MKTCSVGSRRSATNNVLAALLALLVVLAPAAARADEPAPSATAEPAGTVLLTRNGAAGVWMPLPTFRLVLADLTALRLIREREVPELERLLTLERAQGADLRAQVAIAVEAERVATAALDTSEERAGRLAERLARAQRRRPWLFVTGVLAGVLVVVVPVAATR